MLFFTINIYYVSPAQHPNRFFLPGTCASSQSAVIFTGHPTSSGSSGKEGIIATHLLARTELVPNHPTLSPHQSALSMYGRVSNARLPAVLSDDILKSGVCLEGAHVSNVHDQQMESDSDFSQRKGEPRRREDLDSAWKEAEVSSRSVTLKRPAAVVSLERCPTHSPSPDTTDPRDSPQYRSSRGEDEALSAEEHSGSMPGNQDLPGLNFLLNPFLIFFFRKIQPTLGIVFTYSLLIQSSTHFRSLSKQTSQHSRSSC